LIGVDRVQGRSGCDPGPVFNPVASDAWDPYGQG